ncbi:MAG: ribonucleotide-diphosphate reductase subunit alpha, partial [Chloroflexota bacterium]
NLYVTVNSDEKGPFEVFTSLGKAGGCAAAQLEATSRLISLALRSGVDPASLVKHLKGIRCPAITWEEGHAILSCADAIGTVLERHLSGKQEPQAKGSATHTANVALGGQGQCPDCGGMLIYQEGCFVCRSCGYTKCS